MKYLFNNFKKKNNYTLSDYGFILFLLGIFFLPSAIPISIIFLFLAAIIGSFLQKKPFLNDKWNYPFLIFGVIILINSLLQKFVLINEFEGIWDPILSIVGLTNWIPFIWLFWALQPFLNSKIKRRSFSKILIVGTVPVLITGFGQYFFNWNGPFKILNGLITWFLYPIDEKPGGLSGLFNNTNYAGSWLVFVWPFSIALLLEIKKDFFRKAISLGFFLSIGLAAFLTFSRNAWAGLITSFTLILYKKEKFIVLSLFCLLAFGTFFIYSSFFGGNIQNNLRDLIPQDILLEFTNDGYFVESPHRIEMYKSALGIIKVNPIFGIGANSFSIIFSSENPFANHAHNLLFELAISYGLPATIILAITVNIILFLSWIKIFKENKSYVITYIDKAFWTATFFFLISQLADIQYFDGKISILFWLLLIGLKNIIEEHNNKEIYK